MGLFVIVLVDCMLYSRHEHGQPDVGRMSQHMLSELVGAVLLISVQRKAEEGCCCVEMKDTACCGRAEANEATPI